MIKISTITMRVIGALLVLLPLSTSAQSAAFLLRQTLQGVTFQVDSSNQGSINQVFISAHTSSNSLGALQLQVDGLIAKAETADLNEDGYPEIYVYLQSAGSGSYGSLIAFASNKNQSLSRIYLPPIMDQPKLAQGYMGHDEFSVGTGVLVRRFPIYLSGDINAAPSGGVRVVRYKLIAGEAGWILQSAPVVEH